MIRITSKIEGFRRCGVAHSKAVTEYYESFFSSDQLALLQAEPNLTVEICNESGDKTDRKKNK